MEEIKNALNVSVPVYGLITISFDELRSIAKDMDKLEESIQYTKDFMYKSMHYTKGVAYHRIDDAIVDSICLFTAGNDSITKVFINPCDYFTTLQRVLNSSLNITSNYKDVNTINELKNRLRVLSNVTSLEELENEFPLIFDDYVKGMEKYSEASDLRKTNIEENIVKANNIEGELGRCCIHKTFSYFIQRQVLLYSSYLNNFDKIVSICNKPKGNDYNNNYKLIDGVDLDKLQLLIAYKYIELYVRNESKEAAQAISPYLLYILSNNKFKDIYIDLGNDKVFTYSDVKYYFDHMLKKYDIVPYTAPRSKFSGKTKNDAKNIIDNELAIIHIKKSNKGPRRKYTPTGKVLGPRQERNMDELNELLHKKMELFDSSDFIEKFTTEDGYAGYLYFVYPNGLIVRERYYSSVLSYSPALDEALYKSKTEHFFSIHNLNKTALIKLPNDVVRRMYHTGNWEEQIRDYMNEPVTNQKEVEDFIYKVRERKILIPTVNTKKY